MEKKNGVFQKLIGAAALALLLTAAASPAKAYGELKGGILAKVARGYVPVAGVHVPAAGEEVPSGKKVVVIDPGHTALMSGKTEPVGPGAAEMKAADTLGTKGVSTGLTEYELNLEVSQKLREELVERGYEVFLTRENHDLTLSCIERAAIANAFKADAFLRVHANGAEARSAHGAHTICITPSNPYHPELYAESRRLSECVIDEFIKSTGAYRRDIWETDTMTGNNWSEVPVTLIELGFMTNPEEDALMASPDYQEKMVEGMANGIDRFFAEAPEAAEPVPAETGEGGAE